MNIVAVCTGTVREATIRGRRVATAIAKTAVDGDVAVGRLGLAGDEQADPSVHGGVSKAVYAYPSEHHAFWRTVRAQAGVAAWDADPWPGLFGENLLLAGIVEQDLWIGDRLVVVGADGARRCVLAVSEPRRPCFKFAAAIGFPQALALMNQSGYCGAYLGVIETGVVAAGDGLVLEPGPRQVNLRELFRSRVRG